MRTSSEISPLRNLPAFAPLIIVCVACLGMGSITGSLMVNFPLLQINLGISSSCFMISGARHARVAINVHMQQGRTFPSRIFLLCPLTLPWNTTAMPLRVFQEALHRVVLRRMKGGFRLAVGCVWVWVWTGTLPTVWLHDPGCTCRPGAQGASLGE